MKRPENIEALLVDYMDGNLSSNDFLLVEAWLKEHPEDAEVLEDWDSLSLTSTAGHSPETQSAVPEGIDWNDIMIGSIEDTNTAGEQELLDSSMKRSAILKREFQLYQLTKLEADQSILFPRKSELLKTVSIFSIKTRTWGRIAAAAVFTGLISGFLLFNRNTQGEAGLYLARTAEFEAFSAPERDEESLPKAASTLEVEIPQFASSTGIQAKRMDAIQKNKNETLKEKTLEHVGREELQFASLQISTPEISISKERAETHFIPQEHEYAYSPQNLEQDAPSLGLVASALNSLKDRITGERENIVPTTTELKGIAQTSLEKSKRFRVDFEDGKLVAMGLPKLYWEKK